MRAERSRRSWDGCAGPSGALEDYRAARAHTGELGARAQGAVLTVRMAAALVEMGEEERGEEMTRAVIAAGRHVGHEATPAARLFLAMLLSRTGRAAEAREHLRLLREGFGTTGFVVFDGIMAGIQAWIDMVDGEYGRGLRTTRETIDRSLDPLARVVAPQLPAVFLTNGAIALTALDGGARARDAARLLGAARRQLPPGHRASVLERQITEQVEAASRAVLGDEEYAAAYAEGGGLRLEEATALL
ncbi:hypothetical protein GCM10018793_16370 [Streptomyces sulfonofaciens]|uniref:Uncharacterized protein n=1 Tax=Streptomyces sulfonofaciens TaxID=68272 RepID=A0A919KWM0_9ACTN|nr:tetratricopeptide repeat protein [Streptomyces sulfonofaciens]GHH74651.1 hypothetical protein GCM10018793_16370 [Streptomyces sulfonofaciens]